MIYCIACGQTQIKGKVTDDKLLPLGSANITLHKNSQSAIIAFAITDKEGSFIVSYIAPLKDSLELRVAIMGYEKKSFFFINGEKKEFQFKLTPKPIRLPDVKIKNQPVWQRKDSINYSVSEFIQPQDRVIGEIIARLPGMEVKSNGQILYNGKPINKYYIENLDLLDDKYGIANNNIPAEIVEKVQVLENHHPIRVLDSISFSDRAAINIKLKSNTKSQLIGRVGLGIGFTPLITENDITAMLFKKKTQFINVYKFNNTGLDNSKEFNSHNIYELLNSIQSGSIKNDFLSLVQPSPPPIKTKRYLLNNTHTLSVNHLLTINKVYQLRINANYANDFQTQKSTTQTQYFLPSDTVFILEQSQHQENSNIFQTILSLFANTKNYYLKNNFKIEQWQANAENNLFTSQNITQKLNNPFYTISNDFKLITTKNKNIKEWSSYLGFVSQPQDLKITPGIYKEFLNNNQPFNSLLQTTINKTFYSDNHYSLRNKFGKIKSQYKAGFSIKECHLFSALKIIQNNNTAIIADSFQNSLSWKQNKFYVESELTYQNEKFRVTLLLPVSYNFLKYTDSIFEFRNTHNQFLFNPRLYSLITLSPMWSFNNSVSYNQDFGNIKNMHNGYILKNYRSIVKNNAPLLQTSSINLTGSLLFRNPLKVFFFNFNISYKVQKNNLLYQQQFNGNLETLTAILKDNYSRQTNISTRFNKYISDIKTSVALNLLLSLNNVDQIQQNELVKLTNKNFASGISISTKFSPKATIEYSNTYAIYLSQSQLLKHSDNLVRFNQTALLNYYPSDWCIIRISGDYYYISSHLFKPSNYFFIDLNIRYTPKKVKIDFELGVQNIFNTDSFKTGVLANNTEILSVFQIRPRQFLFRINFPLK